MCLLLAAALLLSATGADSHVGILKAGTGFGIGFVVPQGLYLNRREGAREGRLQLQCPRVGPGLPQIAAARGRNTLQSLSMIKVTTVTTDETETSQAGKTRVSFYDTTLRDGAQGEGISLSCDDKLRIARRLHVFGADYIEGGWPGSNPKDAEFFTRARTELPPAAWDKVAAFGSTRYKGLKVEEDKQVQMLVDSEARVITLVGKSWDLHVDEVLETTREENLAMIRDTVEYLKKMGREVMLDAEHFYDGFAANPEYAMQSLGAAVEAGVDWLVLCDTNGGTLPWRIEEVTQQVVDKYPGTKVGIHCHNDQGMAVSNSMAAVRGGASVIQGTVNGFGERTGNANLMSIFPTLCVEMQRDALSEAALAQLTTLSRYVDEQANQPNHIRAAFVGSTQNKVAECFPGGGARDMARRRIDPEVVGNARGGNAVTQTLSRGGDIEDARLRDSRLMASLKKYSTEEEIQRVYHQTMATVHELERKGYFFEGADASVDLMLRRSLPGYRPPFDTLEYHVNSISSDASQYQDTSSSQATVKVRVGKEVVQRFVLKELRKLGDIAADAANMASIGVGSTDGQVLLEVAEGNGPVNALAKALVKALLPLFPSLEFVELRDYKVRILDNDAATAAIPRVLIEFQDTQLGTRWTTASADANIISASFNALVDGVEYHIEHRNRAQEDESWM